MEPSDGPALTSEHLPLSLSQLEVWRDQHAWPGSTHLNLGGTAFFEGPLDLNRLRRALSRLVAQNAALRLVLRRDGGQHLLPRCSTRLPVIVFRPCRAAQTIAALVASWMAQPFRSCSTRRRSDLRCCVHTIRCMEAPSSSTI